MRGGRFQQKVTEDASARSAEALFESRSVGEIREVESQTWREIEVKKEELRQLVGASYRDLIESADSIVSMKNSCRDVAQNIQSIQRGFSLLKQSAVVHPSSTPNRAKERGDQLLEIGSRVKYIVDTPEKIWGCLDEHMYLEGAQRYFRAREVHSLLMEFDSKMENQKEKEKEVSGHFPLLRHQWPLVETFRANISQRSRDRLLEPGLDPAQYAVALAAVAVIDELDPPHILALFLDSRRAWLKGHLRTAFAIRERVLKEKSTEKLEKKMIDPNMKGKPAMETSDLVSIAGFFTEILSIVRVSLCHIGQLFREVNEDLPLFFSMVLYRPPSSQLFGGIPNPEEEVRLWKLHREKLESMAVPLSGESISDACLSWIRTCEEDLNTEGKLLLELVGHLRDLSEIERRLIEEETESFDAFEGSMEWLRSAFGQVIDSPWGCISGLLLNEEMNLWNALFDRLFVVRAKLIIDSCLTSITVKSMVENIMLAISPVSHLHLHDSAIRTNASLQFSSSSEYCRSTERNQKIIEGSARQKLLQEYDNNGDDSFALTTTYLDQEVAHITEEIDGKLSVLFEDLKSFIQSQSRIDELGPYFQEQCFACISGIVGDLQEKLSDLYDEMKKASRRPGRALNILWNSFDNSNGKTREFAEADAAEIAGLVEKALFLGRLFVSLTRHSSSLPAVLQSPTLLSSEETSHARSPLLSMGRSRHAGLEVGQISTHFNTFPKGRHGRISSSEVDKSSKLSKLRLALKRSSLLAHCMWVSWSTEELSARLARALQNDDDLTSSSPLKGWEETLIRQENEDGSEIEMKVPLPALPSTYVTTFLFTGCQEIYRIGGHALDKTILHLFARRLLEKVLSIYENFILETENLKDQVSEKGYLQLSFDLRFLGDILSGGNSSTSEPFDFLNEDSTLQSLLPTSLVVKSRQMIFQAEPVLDKKKLLSSLLRKSTNKLDPIDWATYEPFLWENEINAYKSNAVLFGFFVQLNRLHAGSFQKSSSSEPNIFKVSSAIPRFSYLPISTPSMMRKTATNDESLGSSWRSHSNRGNSKVMFEDDSDMASVLGAKPLFRSFMNQVGSKLGDGTFKLGSMLTDGQVSRLKDRSAAAISTFGDILPVQAAGLFSSFTTAGAS